MADNNEAQKNHKELIERLKAEGQLTRNTGTNSLKSVKKEFSKFDDTFEAMRSTLKIQGAAITELVGIQKEVLQLDKSQEQRAIDAARLASVGKDVIGDTKKDGEKSDTKKTTGNNWIGGFLGKIGPGLGAFLGAGLAGATALLSPMRLGGLLLRAIPLITLAPLIGNFIGDFVAEGLTDLGAGPEATEQMRGAFNKAGRWGAMGAIFGLKGAAIGFFAGALSSFGKSLLNLFDIDEDSDLSILGINTTALGASETILAALGGTLALLAPSLLKLTGKLLLGVLTGPLGIAALTGAAIAGTVLAVDAWMENRRNEFIDELEEKTKEGFAAADKIAVEEDTPFLRRLAGSLGATPQTATEEFDQLRRTVDAAAEQTGMGSFGEAGSRMVLDVEKRESLQRSFLETMKNEGDILELTRRNLLDRKDVAEKLGLSDIVSQIDSALQVQSIKKEIQDLIESERILHEQSTLSGLDVLPRSQQVQVENIRERIRMLESQIETLPSMSTGSNGFQDFGKGTLSVLHGLEAVVPRSTPAGEVLATMFDENFQPKFDVNTSSMAPVLDQISTSAHNVVNNIVFAPTTMNPVTSVSQGGSTVSSVTTNAVTSFGGGNGGSGLGRFAN